MRKLLLQGRFFIIAISLGFVTQVNGDTIREFQKAAEDLRTRFRDISYVTDFTVTTYSIVKPRKPTDPIVVAVLSKPVSTEGRITRVSSNGDERTSVQIKASDPAHKSNQFSTDGVYEKTNEALRVYLKRDNTLRVDLPVNGRQFLLPRPNDITMFEDLLSYDLTDQWPYLYSGVTRTMLDRKLAQHPLVKELDPPNDPTKLRETLDIPSLSTAAGTMQASRVIEFSREFTGFPSRIEKIRFRQTEMVVELKWATVKNGNSNVVVPAEMTVQRYFPADFVATPHTVPMEVTKFVFALDQYKFDVPLDSLKLNFPEGARVYDTRQLGPQNIIDSEYRTVAPPTRTSSAGPSRPDNKLLLVTLGVMVVPTVRYVKYRLAQSVADGV
jgi:hypothetical protein